jgi:hypothetical protein
MKVLCVKWNGEFFRTGEVYSLDGFGCVYNPTTNYSSAEPWYMYTQSSSCFIPATDLIIALF